MGELRRGGGWRRVLLLRTVSADDSADDVVVVRLGDLDGDEVARVGDAVVDVDLPVDFRRLALVAADQEEVGLGARPSTSTSRRWPTSCLFCSRLMRFWVAMISRQRRSMVRLGTLPSISKAAVPSSSEYWKTPSRSKRCSLTKALRSSKSSSVSPGRPTISEVRKVRPGTRARILATSCFRKADVAAALHRAQQAIGGVLQRHVEVVGDLRLVWPSPR